MPNLKRIILNEYTIHNLQRYTPQPLFVTLRSNTIKDIIVNSSHYPSAEDTLKIKATTNTEKHGNHNLTLPHLRHTQKPHSCCRLHCTTCQHFYPSNYIHSSTTNETFYIRHPFSCDSKNIIYLITCTNCKKQYVGKSAKTLRERICQHHSSIKKDQCRYISKHFNLSGHSVARLKVQVIDSTDTGNSEHLHKLELYWINKLKSTQPNGLNILSE